MLSNLSYLSYPLPPDVQRLFEAGDFERMNRVIDMRLADPCTPECLKDRLRFQQEIARRLPRYYQYTQAQILEKLKARIRDFEESELEALYRRRGALPQQLHLQPAQNQKGICGARNQPGYRIRHGQAPRFA